MPNFGTVSAGGVLIHVLVPDGFVPLPVAEVIEARTHVPYGNNTVIDDGGLGPKTLPARARVDPDDRITFESLNGFVVDLLVYGTAYTGKLYIKSASGLKDGSLFNYDIELVF